jgi:P2 family phage contractile tail tube protein
MSAASQIFKNFALYIDGRGYAGNVDEVQLPDLKIKLEEYRAGGMDSSIGLDMGMEKMEASFKLSKYDADVLALWGMGPSRTVQLTLRGALESLDGSVSNLVVNLEGTIDSMTPDALTPGAKAGLQATMSVRHYKNSINGVVVHDIDVMNMVRIVGGVDRLAKIRTALGM